MKSIMLGTLLGSVLSQGAFAAATVTQTVVNKTLNNTAKTTVATYLVSSDGTPYYGSCTASMATSSATCPTGSSTAGFQTWSAQAHTPAAIAYKYYVPSAPALAAGTSTSPLYTPLGVADSFGVALDGIPFDPLTGVCAESSTKIVAVSASLKCAFRVEGRLQLTQSTATVPSSSSYTTQRLGFDPHNGHNQSTGAYHYHGIPCGIAFGGAPLVSCNPMSTSNPWSSLPAKATIVGYARDGYPIVVQAGVYSSYSAVTAASSSNRPAIGTSPGTTTTYFPYGAFSMDMSALLSGTSTTFSMPSNKTMGDFVYNGPSGYGTGTAANKLGLCNEAPNTDSAITTVAGAKAAYAYYLTPNFPMVPRCLIGVTDAANLSTAALGFYHSGTD
ncbi:MAG: YHYH protein [Sulfuricella sp.]|nr:YHYH protein [Sulfuricella sp.]